MAFYVLCMNKTNACWICYSCFVYSCWVFILEHGTGYLQNGVNSKKKKCLKN
uniref:Uncharacterized protein n=1 Tax=Anguilla anguilla TaxID=7936 RepID=A0A0E9QZZ6_ANGAN